MTRSIVPPLFRALLCAAALYLAACGTGNANGPSGPNGANKANGGLVPETGSGFQVALSAQPPSMPWINTAALTADGQEMVFVTDDAQVWRWNLAKGTLRLDGVMGTARERFELRPNAQLAVAVGGEAPRIFNVKDRTELMRFTPWRGAELVRWSADGDRFALARKDGGVAVWDVAAQLAGHHKGEKLEDFLKRQEARFRVDFPGEPTALAMAPDGRLIIALNDPKTQAQGTIYVWDPDAGTQLKFLGRTNRDVTHLTVSEDSKHVALISDDGSLRVVSTDNKPKGFRPWSVKLKAEGLDWTAQNTLIYYAPDKRARAIDPVSGEELWRTDNVEFLRCWSARERVICSDGRSLSIIDSHTGEMVVTAAAWSGMFMIFGKDGVFSGDAPPEQWLRVAEDGIVTKLSAEEWREKRKPQEIGRRSTAE